MNHNTLEVCIAYMTITRLLPDAGLRLRPPHPQVMQSAGSMQGASLVNGSNGSGGLGSGGRSRELVQRTNSHDMTERASDINIAQIIPASELTYLGDIAQGAEGKVYLVGSCWEAGLQLMVRQCQPSQHRPYSMRVQVWNVPHCTTSCRL